MHPEYRIDIILYEWNDIIRELILSENFVMI